jgi:hypothetical protein
MKEIQELKQFKDTVRLYNSMEKEEKKLKTVQKKKNKMREEYASRNQ